VWLFIGAFGIRVLYAIVIQATSGAHGFIAFSDAEYFYYGAAKNLLSQHVFSIATHAPYYPDAYHTPLYPLFIAALMFLRFNLFGVVLIQDIFATILVLLTYKIAFKLTNSKPIAVFAAVLSIIEPMSIYWSGLLMSDVFFAVLVCSSFYALISEKYIPAAIYLGLSALARPIALLFVPAYILMRIYQGHLNQKKFNIALQEIVAMILIIAVFVAPWFARNKIVFNTWQYTSAGWYDLYVSPITVFATKENLPLPKIDPGKGNDYDFTRFSFVYSPLYRNADISVIKEDTPGYLRFQTIRSVSSLFSDRYEYLIKTVLAAKAPSLFTHIPNLALLFVLSAGQIFWLCIYLLVLAALLDKKNLHWWLFFATLVGINAAISGGINPGGSDMSRYSLPFYPFFFTFAGIGFIQVRRFFMDFIIPGNRTSATKR